MGPARAVLSDSLGFLNAGTFALVAFWEYTHRLLFLHFLQRNGYLANEAHRPDDREVLEPFLGELPKYQKLGSNTEANEMCMGLLLRLHRLERESTTEFKDWTFSAAGIFAKAVVDAWKASSQGDVRRGSDRGGASLHQAR